MAPKQFPKGTTALQVLEGQDLTGKYALITGANCGIGFETALALAVHNAHVVLACRNPTRASQAKDKILEKDENAQVSFLPLDCSDMASVEACAEKYLERGWPLHYLILNAGVYNPLHRITDAGFEATFQINHLSQFYLSQLLEQKLIESAPSRVIVLTSDSHASFTAEPNEITWSKLSPSHKPNLNSAYKAYGISKCCNILFAKKLNERLSNSDVTAYSVHPGAVETSIARNSSGLKIFFTVFKPIVVTADKGAATTVYCATIPELEGDGGKYFVNCKPKQPSRSANNDESATKLWELSEEMIRHYKQTVTKQL